MLKTRCLKCSIERADAAMRASANQKRPTGQAHRPGITVRNLQRKVVVDTVLLQRFAERALRICCSSRTTQRSILHQLRQIFILLISDRRMSSLHRRFLNQPGSTDVITFNHGEIFVSAETAGKNARRFNTSPIREIQLYVVHGLLHLNGFDDQTRASARKMAQRQQKILSAVSKPGGRGDDGDKATDLRGTR
jgi:probable rRNA maturation factor